MMPRFRTRLATGVDCLELGLSLHHKWEITEFVWGRFGIVFRFRHLGRNGSDY